MLSQQLRDARDLVVPPWAVPPYASKQNGGYNASISVQTRGGGTAASVAVPRRSARIAGTAGGNQAVSTHEDDGASSRSPPRPAHSRSPSCQGSPQSQSAASPLPCSSPKSLLPAPRQSESSLPRKPPVPTPSFSSSYSFSQLSRSYSSLLSRLSSLLPNSVRQLREKREQTVFRRV